MGFDTVSAGKNSMCKSKRLTLASYFFQCFVFTILCFENAFPVCAHDVFALLPFQNKTPEGEYEWVGYGYVLRLKEYLNEVEDAGSVKQDGLYEVAKMYGTNFSNPISTRKVERIGKNVGATYIIWGEYEVRGKTIFAQVNITKLKNLSHTKIDLTRRVSSFNVLVQRIFSEIYRIRGRSVPAFLRGQWMGEPALDESYEDYVLAQDSRRLPAERRELLRRYLIRHPRDLRANLQLADLLRGGGVTEAIKIYKHTLEWAPNCGLAYANLGYLLSQQILRDEARSHYKTAIQCEDQYHRLYLNYGNLLRHISLEAEAIQVYKQGVQLFPDRAYLHFNLSILYENEGFHTEAIRSYREANRLDNTLSTEMFLKQYYLEDRWINLPSE